MYEEGASLLDSVLRVFKRGCRDQSRALRLTVCGLLFRLLDQFAAERNAQAPVLYKILTFALLENINDDVTREFMLTSFTEVFTHHSSIPVTILLEPLLK